MARSTILFLTFFSLPLQLLADPNVQFDVPSYIAVEEVSSAEFLANHHDEKLIRITVPISTLVPSTDNNELHQCLFLISGSQVNPFHIVDFLPTTTLATDVDGTIATERSEDESASVGLHASAPKDFPIPANADSRISSGSRISEKLKRLPAKRLLFASGTMHRGVSAYFKLKPSTQTTLEGTKDFTITVRVPSSWRAGMLYVNCAAFGKKTRSTQGFVVGTYLTGDFEAKDFVEEMAVRQSQLKQLAQRHSGQIDDRRFPSVGHRIGGALSVVKPKIPHQWLNQLLTSTSYHRFERHLPRELQNAATNYREARDRVIELAGQQSS